MSGRAVDLLRFSSYLFFIFSGLLAFISHNFFLVCFSYELERKLKFYNYNKHRIRMYCFNLLFEVYIY